VLGASVGVGVCVTMRIERLALGDALALALGLGDDEAGRMPKRELPRKRSAMTSTVARLPAIAARSRST